MHGGEVAGDEGLEYFGTDSPVRAPLRAGGRVDWIGPHGVAPVTRTASATKLSSNAVSSIGTSLPESERF